MKNSEEGSVLIEALAALAIIFTVIIMALNGLSEAVRALERAEMQMSALAEARSRLAEVSGADFLSSSVKEGVSETGLAWKVIINEDGSSADPRTARPFRVSVEVEAIEATAGGSSVALDTIIIARRPLR
jgi:type II secretory pathway pseudopilin PulG